ncbi:TPA: hypothetical protein N0F65_011522 [Lagenidium giganteum]|uniref:tRNA-dihydrouridine(16/17) synthase [NAD(P)(+)] n=1 Tax=Lagenidium giganteum TaxID=4803 RepID=A0AAV2Z5A0_9STRA|nr:TPA: hypothetical protein N0F65_011522 [Lagenidium giganteum]
MGKYRYVCPTTTTKDANSPAVAAAAAAAASSSSSSSTDTAECMRAMTKLRGYDFFNAIGAPKRVVAPMVDQSELAFRMLCRQHGAELCYTPMFHSRLFTENAEYRARMFEQHMKDRPLIVQFCGNDPKVVLEAAKHVEAHCDAVDLNLGCPQGIARKGRYGSFLMKEKDVVREIVQTLSDNLSVPVTVKIRIFPDEQETLEFCDMLQAAGADLLCVHGRTKEMNKTAVEECDWDIIRRIKQRMKIPVLANGGIEVPADVQRCLDHTQADGVMSSEAILENPALFAATHNDPCPRDGQEPTISYVELAQQYIECAKEYPPTNDKIVRAHLFKILFQDLRTHTDLRSALGSVRTREAIYDVVAQLAARVAAAKTDPSLPQAEYAPETTWYRRHRRGQEKLKRLREEAEQTADKRATPADNTPSAAAAANE